MMKMNIEKRMRPAALLAAALLAVSATVAFAQDYPNGTVRLVVPFPPGGGGDSVARLINNKLGEELGRTVIIENRGGAGSLIGTEEVRRATPDGLTLLFTSGTYTTTAVLDSAATFDPLEDFIPISLIAVSPSVLVVNPATPYDTVDGIVSAAKENPEAVTSGIFGALSIGSIATKLLELEADVAFKVIPYQGGGAAQTAVLSNEIEMMFSSVSGVIGLINNGQLRPVAVASDARMPALPDVPTFRESGVDLMQEMWFGALAPKDTPDEVIGALEAAFAAILEDPEVRESLERQGLVITGLDSEAARQQIANDVEMLTPLKGLL